MKVPDVLVSGNHAEIEKWRREQAKAADERAKTGFDEMNFE